MHSNISRFEYVGKTGYSLSGSATTLSQGMAKRKQEELAADHPDGGVSEVGGFEVLKGYLYAHPIWKSLQVDKFKDCDDIDSSSPHEIPPSWRSKRRVGGGMIVQDSGGSKVGILEESRNQCHFATHPRRPRNVRRKQKAQSSDSGIISQPSYCNCRQTRKQPGCTTVTEKWGKLDTETFECYMESLWRRFTAEKKSLFTYLDSLWFSLYTKETYKEKVLSWIKRKDIFTKKYVLVPIVQWGHWFLLIFCHFGESLQSEAKNRCMLLLDSLQNANSKQLEPGIRRFVFDIFKKEERPEKKELINKIPLLIPKVPQQKGGEECGFFVLYYINLFLESAPDNSSFPLGYSNFMKEDWFTPEEVERFINNLDLVKKSS